MSAEQRSLFGETTPDFDGSTYVAKRDKPRLFPQLVRVASVLADGEWHTLPEIQNRTGDPQASISARIRDLRKPKFGGHRIEHEYVNRGLWRYRLVRE